MSETDIIETEEEVVETNPIEDLVNQITTGELAKAEGSFKSILDDKLVSAIDAQRVQVAQNIFDKDEEDSEDITDEELTDEELTDEELAAIDAVMDEDEDILAELEDDEIEEEIVEDEVVDEDEQ